ncbi:MAG: hypothetical protein QOK37_1763 [Thermoanaerobaculia bacterium]|jgi:hypothetical protein|nr:hypothetical protein [Thermoanaerobaculia bacterium]
MVTLRPSLARRSRLPSSKERMKHPRRRTAPSRLDWARLLLSTMTSKRIHGQMRPTAPRFSPLSMAGCKGCTRAEILQECTAVIRNSRIGRQQVSVTCLMRSGSPGFFRRGSHVVTLAIPCSGCLTLVTHYGLAITACDRLRRQLTDAGAAFVSREQVASTKIG